MGIKAETQDSKDYLGEVKHDFKHDFEDAKSQVISAADRGINRSKELAHQLGEKVAHGVEEKPLTSMAIAFATGALVTAGVSMWVRSHRTHN